jgi:predicted Ser/Thr protein kinase
MSDVLPRQSLFGRDTKLTMKNCSTNDEQITIGALVGSGSFAHVVQLEERMFMKISRSKPLVMSLEKEFKILQKLQGEPFFPFLLCRGVTLTVNVSVRSDLSTNERAPVKRHCWLLTGQLL